MEVEIELRSSSEKELWLTSVTVFKHYLQLYYGQGVVILFLCQEGATGNHTYVPRGATLNFYAK